MKENDFSLSNCINKYRSELLGFAAIMIIICHSTSVIEFPVTLEKFIAFGTTGVYLFAFLSGIGLFFSMKKQKRNSLKAFYIRRFERVGVPYLLIAGVWYAILYLIIEHSVTSFFYELSTVSFWLEHKGAWYVAMLIPLYLLYPFLHLWLDKGKARKKIVILICGISAVSILLEANYYSLFEHLSQIVISIIVFLVGEYAARYILGNKHKENKLFVYSIIFLIIRFVTPLNQIEYICHLSVGVLGIVITITMSYIFDKLTKSNFLILNTILRFFGKQSLELYLTNIFILQALQQWNI